ncbi:MAG: hypothetical protein AAFY88_11810, partial [Acidobacteriota bacterium]
VRTAIFRTEQPERARANTTTATAAERRRADRVKGLRKPLGRTLLIAATVTAVRQTVKETSSAGADKPTSSRRRQPRHVNKASTFGSIQP